MNPPFSDLAPVATQTRTPGISLLPRIEWDAPDLEQMTLEPLPGAAPARYRLFRVDEISTGGSSSYRLAMANVLASLSDTECSIVYLLSGTPDGVSLYVGVSAPAGCTSADVPTAADTLRAAFEGNFLGAQLHKVENDDPHIHHLLADNRHVGLITGVPTLNEKNDSADESDFQGVERLVNSLVGETWQLLIVAEPTTDAQIRETVEQIYDLSTTLSEHIKQSVQKGESSSLQSSQTQGSSDSQTSGSSQSHTTGTSQSDTSGSSQSKTAGTSQSDTKGNSQSQTAGTSQSDTKGNSQSQTAGTSQSDTKGSSHSQTAGSSRTSTTGTSTNTSRSKTDSSSSRSTSESGGEGTSSSRADGHSNSNTSGSNQSNTHGSNQSNTTGTNDSRTSGHNQSSTTGTNDSRTSGSNQSDTTGTNDSTTTGSNRSDTTGTTQGESLTLTRERTDKRAERLQKHISEDLIERFLRGRSKGMFRTAIYACAEKSAIFDRLARGVLSIYQGNRSSVTPLRITRLGIEHPALGELLQIRQMSGTAQSFSRESALTHSMPSIDACTLPAATWLNTTELALMAGLPAQELPGLSIRKSVDFALNSSTLQMGEPHLKLGAIIQHGRELRHKTVNLPLRELNKHLFVTGVTGAGKTTTCMKLLLESGLPFLVIEPAKTEYRALHGNPQGHTIDYYSLGREDLTPFRLNPFELLRGQKNLASHIAVLKATLAAVFPMEAAMPQIVEEAIINAYKAKGWDIHSGENYFADDPWSADSEVWPTFSDMIEQLEKVIQSKGMGKEFEEKYQGSLVARLTNLTAGTKGRMLNARRSLDFMQLLDRRVVIELEELKDGQDKALLMGLILGRLAECMKQRHRQNPSFQHLTLLEEAHRLLSRPEPGDSGSQKMGVEMFANLLAEVRKYGEGLIIADQIPNKLVSDVIKNTNTKIVHRLFAADDRNTIGDSMGLSDEQKDFLPLLMPGETIIYCGGWHAPVRVQIAQDTRTDHAEIDEQAIRQRGCEQLWEQRHTLLPQLSAHPSMHTAELLAQFLHQGGHILNLLLRLNHSRDAGKTPLRQRLAAKLNHRIQQQQQGLAIDPAPLADLLTRLLLDCGTGLRIVHEDRAVLRPALQTAIELLQQSLSAFDENIASSGSEAKHVFGKHLKNFDSL